MAYCPECKKESLILIKTADPHCSICFNLFRYPQATTKELFEKYEQKNFEKAKIRIINLLEERPKKYSIDIQKQKGEHIKEYVSNIFGFGILGAIGGGIVGYFTKEILGWVIFFVLFLIGLITLHNDYNQKTESANMDNKKRHKENKAELKRIRNLTYSHENNKKLH